MTDDEGPDDAGRPDRQRPASTNVSGSDDECLQPVPGNPFKDPVLMAWALGMFRMALRRARAREAEAEREGEDGPPSL